VTLADVQNALVAWVQLAAANVNPDVTNSQVIWSGTQASDPEAMFIELRMGDILALGARDEEQTSLVPDWVTGTVYAVGAEVIDAQSPSVLWQCTTAGPSTSTVSPGGSGDGYVWLSLGLSAGQEIQITEFERGQFALTVQCFGTTGQEEGVTSPSAVLQQVRQALQLPTQRDALGAVGVSCFDRGPVRNVAALAGTIFEPRAIFESSWYINSTLSENVGYIETVDATGTITSDVPASPITEDVTIDLP
jgi:hypothetical protein